MKEERLLSSDYDRVADASAPNLVGCGAAFVKNLVDLKDHTVVLPDKAREDYPLLVHIQRNRDVCFSVLCSHFLFSHSCSLIPVYAGTDDLRQHKCLSI